MQTLPSPSPPVSTSLGPGSTSFTPTLTSTTAPGKTFTTRTELQSHYKSDWHRYNLKRREANLPMLNESDFNARLEAAMALRKEREGREERSGLDHRKDKNDTKKKKKKQKQQAGKHKRKPAFAKREESNIDNTQEENSSIQDDTSEVASMEEEEEEEPPEINPCQSLFDNFISTSPEANLKYMQQQYSFFLPDLEYCIDLEGLLGYCNEKIRLGNICLYCQRSFKSSEGVLKHMKDKEHCKILYERGVDQEEFDVFYDFSKLNNQTKKSGNGEEDNMAVGEEAEGEEEWEDVSDDDDQDDVSMKDEEDDDLYEGYQEEIASQGFDITPLGELIMPDGRIIGHRGLARYYKQRFAPDRMERAAVRHARAAGGERMYNGRVVNLYQREEEGGGESGSSSTALATMGRMAGAIPTGRQGKGILVAGGGKGGFTALSLYRYRAVVRKQRKDDRAGERMKYEHTTGRNMNKMDKKANRLMNGVSVAHAKR